MTQTEHTDGPPWKIISRLATFEEADKKRYELVQDKDLQVKIHWQGPQNKKYFAVKTRVDPEIVAKQKATRKKRTKKRSKK